MPSLRWRLCPTQNSDGHPRTQTDAPGPCSRRDLGQESISEVAAAVALARSSHRRPQSGLQLPPPKWLFLFSWNFLLALIFILYLFSSAENWHLMCPVRLCGSSLIDLVASPWPQLCQRAQPWARPFPVPSFFPALPRVSQRSRGGPGCPESRRSPSQAPTQEIWLPAALHPPFLARAFPSWSAGCSKPCTSRHPTFDEAWAGPCCSSGSFPKHCRSDQNLSCCLQP